MALPFFGIGVKTNLFNTKSLLLIGELVTSGKDNLAGSLPDSFQIPAARFQPQCEYLVLLFLGGYFIRLLKRYHHLGKKHSVAWWNSYRKPVNLWLKTYNGHQRYASTLGQSTFVVVVVVVFQSVSCDWGSFFVTPWTAAYQASLSFTVSWNLLKFMSIELVMPSDHLILCYPLLLLPSVSPSIRVFFSESALHISCPMYYRFSFSISPSNEYSGLIFFRTDWFDLLVVQETFKSLLQFLVFLLKTNKRISIRRLNALTSWSTHFYEHTCPPWGLPLGEHGLMWGVISSYPLAALKAFPTLPPVIIQMIQVNPLCFIRFMVNSAHSEKTKCFLILSRIIQK